MTRQHRGFTHVHPPGLSLTRGPRMERGPFGLNPGLRTPQLPTTHARAGTGHRALTWATSPSLASHQPSHLTRATSCRTERFIPFLEFPPEVRKIIYTTNSIESLNYQLRKIIKNRGHFPNDDAVIKLLWLAIRDIEDKRARERAKEAGRPKGQPRKAPSKLVEGATVQGWNAAYGALSLAFPGRLEVTL
jgi:Transposase, Mutator family